MGDDKQQPREKMSNQYEPYKPKRNFVSKYAEFQFGEWRKRRNKLFVTMETIVPPMPTTILEEPDETKYLLEVEAVNEKISQLQDLIKEKNATLAVKFNDMSAGQKGRNPIKDKLRELFTELKTYQDEKKQVLAGAEKLET